MSPLAAFRAFQARRREIKRTRQLHRDPIGVFLAERTRPCADSTIPAPLLFAEYARWAEANGTIVRAPIWLSRALADRGYRKRVGNGIHWVGVDLLVEEAR